MHPSTRSGYVEAVDQWKVTVRSMASLLPGYEEAPLGAATGIWGNVIFPLANHAFLDRQLGDIHDMQAVTDTVCGFALSRKCPWMFAVLEPWLPAGAADVLRAHGLEPAMHLTYMTATDLHPPNRPEPQLEYERVNSEDLAQLVLDMNCECYGMPAETGRSALAGGAMWMEDTYGYIGYSDGTPVSTATTLNDGDCLNAICVATPAQHQRRGYAEAVLRHSLREAQRGTGLRRMVLHATDAGYPIYKRMGFEPVVSMMVWAPVHDEGQDC